MEPDYKNVTIEKRKFYLSSFLGAVSTGIFFYSINNFLVDVYNISAGQRGVLEFFREMPGMLLFLLIAPLASVREGKILFYSLITVSVGIAGCAFSPDLIPLTFWLFIWSIGAHLAITMRESFCVALSSPEERGEMFGNVRSLRSLGTIAGAGIIWTGMEYMQADYLTLYLFAAFAALMAAIATFFMKEPGHTGIKRKRFLIKKKYSLFYILAALFGIRKQLFLVFGPWILIRIFHQNAPQMAKLAIVSAVAGIFIKPWLGRCIDRFGERKTLMADALVLTVVCLVYATGEYIMPPAFALPTLFLCYIIDDCLFSLRSAHVTYLSRIIDSPDELTVSISTSYSIEHVVSMAAPPVAGIIWVQHGYSWVFLGAAIIALAMLTASSFIPDRAG